MCLRNRGFTLPFLIPLLCMVLCCENFCARRTLSLCLPAYDLILIGFPPLDMAWRGYIYSIARKYGREEIRAGRANLFVFGFCRPSQAPRTYCIW
ncbi:hypothetical protein BGY98DRAFT_1015455 [Russula aff. rugulosa BPL654]|nr:hypothetical protein BGY98DRAFT_1015455 [Russula aff. rugulosa BPL654]